MKTKIEVDIKLPKDMCHTAVIDAIKVTLMSIGVEVESLSATNGHITLRETYVSKPKQTGDSNINKANQV